MPGMDGMALLDAIRERDSRTPVILVTGWGAGEYDHLLEVDQYLWVLCKPIQVAQMQNSLQEAGSTLTTSIESSVTPLSSTQKDGTEIQENA
jgi:YesN/AraC family two-component response regulator